MTAEHATYRYLRCVVNVMVSAFCKFMGFLHHNQTFDGTITFFNYDIKNLIMMRKSHGLLNHKNWISGESKFVH